MKVLPIALLALAACAPAVHVTVYRPLAPRTDTATVAILSEPPQGRAYEEIGLIQLAPGESGAGYGALILRARAEAAKLGADAVIVARTPRRHVGIFANRGSMPPGAVAVEGEIPRVTAIPIVWKPDTTRAHTR